MLVQPPRETSTLILRELEIPSRTQPPLPSGEWGINRAAAWLVFPDKGLQIFLHPWSSMGKGDKVELLLDGNNVVDQLTLAKDADVGQRVTLFVAPRHLQTGSHTLTYRVTRLNQGAETQTPPTRIYVKLEIPGGQDIDPEPGHSNLFMHIPPEIVSGGVDQDNAEAGVPIVIRAQSGSGVPYPDAAVGDVITLSWGGILRTSPPVTAEQISDAANHPIIIRVDKATIEEAGDTDYAGLAVTFLVTDIVGNQTEDWCTETRITVSISTVRLPAPIAKDAFNNKIDLDQLGTKDLTIQVWAREPEFKRGDIILVKMRGTSLDGESIEADAPSQTIDNLPHTYEVKVNNDDARQLVQTQVIFSYALERSGSTEPLRSKNQFVQIDGEVERLAAPIAEDAHQGAIDPDLPAARIRIPYNPLIQVGMAIELSWVGTRPDGSTYDPKLEWYFPSKSEADNPQGFTISVEGTHLKTLEGGKLELSYALLSEKDNDDILRRESHKAAQLNVGEPLLELVAPLVLGEKDGALEPDDLPNGISQLTAPKSAVNPTKPKDVVTYTWVGEVSGKTENEITLNSLSAGKDVNFPLDAAFVATDIEPNRGKKIAASYRVWSEQTGTTSYSNLLVFSVGAVSGKLTFTNAPFTVAPGGRVKNIELLLINADGAVIPGGKLSLTLPNGFKFADGGGGTREFITDVDGTLSVSGVISDSIPGPYTMTAASGSEIVPALVTITKLASAGTVSVGNTPYWSAVSRDGTFLYVCNWGDNTVSAINTETHTLITRITVEKNPWGVTFSPDGTYAYVGNQNSNSLSIIQTATHARTKNIKIDQTPTMIAVSPNGKWIYICNYTSNTILILDGKTHAEYKRISIPDSPWGVIFSQDSSRAYVSRHTHQSIAVIETTEHTVINNILAGAQPDGIAIAPNGTFIYVAHRGENKISVIDVKTEQKTADIPVGLYPWGVVFSGDGRKAYVTHYQKNSISVIDTTAHKKLAEIPAGGIQTGIAISPDGTRLYISNTANNQITIIEI